MSDEPAAPATGTEGEPTEPTPEPPDPKPEPKPTETVDFWKTQARENEKRAKANATAAKELEKLKASMMSDQEKAVTEAEARGRTAALSEGGKRLAAAEAKAALTGVVPDPAAIVEELDLARYVTDDGDVDMDAVGKLKAKYEAMRPNGDAPRDPDFGARPPAVAAQGPDAAMDNWLRNEARR